MKIEMKEIKEMMIKSFSMVKISVNVCVNGMGAEISLKYDCGNKCELRFLAANVKYDCGRSILMAYECDNQYRMLCLYDIILCSLYVIDYGAKDYYLRQKKEKITDDVAQI